MIPAKLGKGFNFGSNRSIPLHRERVVRYNDVMKRDNDTSVLERLLDPVSQSLNVEAARKLVRLKADPKTQARVDVLARKCNDGDLTAEERAEYERFVTVGNVIAILQAKARLLLSKQS